MKNAKLIENQYKMVNEGKYGSLFATSNGYMGIRGSLEENSTLSVQGGFIRGLIDEIPFNQPLTIENEYMREYYVNEDAAKDTEVQEGVINFADILLIKISVDGQVFYPWEGKILKWERVLDIENNVLTRCVLWQSNNGDITEFLFERFASFANDHVYSIKVSITPKNHNKKIKIISGLDLRTKSNGFKMCSLEKVDFFNDTIKCVLKTKGKYAHKFYIGIVNNFESNENISDDKFLTQSFTYQSESDKTFILEKKIFVCTSRDTDGVDLETGIKILHENEYSDFYEKHIIAWKKFFENIDIKIVGDDRADLALRFCNYHTAISIPKNDSVHSLGAKNLTGEAYNNYIWWDCEVYQCPVFIYSGIENVKNMLIYRYDRLGEAKKIAHSEGRNGARYPFISSVTGEEKVWKHVRHPYMQYHVVADVAWGVLNYYFATDDHDFMKDYGIEMLSEISDYWVSRVEFLNEKYVINEVTGCDEHHPYVNNDAYTNYLVYYILISTTKICKDFKTKVNANWDVVAKQLYLPMEKGCLIPQFDGYFDLSQTLESEGSNGGGFQMKQQGGMYHKSQIIKQPDVMVLFSYIHNDFDNLTYSRNWDYYESMCEASSSLTSPVHAICAFDNNQLYKGYKYFLETAEMDLENLHGDSANGIHAGCAAGAWYSIVRGLCGIEMYEDFVEINPKMLPWWKEVSFKLKWHGISFEISINNDNIKIVPQREMKIKYNKEIIQISKKTILNIL